MTNRGSNSPLERRARQIGRISGFCFAVFLSLAPNLASAQDCVDWYQDADGDGYGDENVVQNLCDGSDPGSGWRLNAGDCDDGDALVNPAANELCDDVDNDCDGTNNDGLPLYAYYTDGDGDGFGDPTEMNPACGLICVNSVCVADNGDDCDDTNAAIHPGAEESCNHKDDDCDGEEDEGLRSTLYLDRDGDLHGDDSTETDGYCGSDDDLLDLSLGEWVLDGGDCDDLDVEVHPGASEECDGIDNDCDGVADESPACDDCLENEGFDPIDNDGDGYTDLGPDGLPQTSDDDCDDSNAGTFPGASESCDGIDNDCDGFVDASDDDGNGQIDSEEDTECWDYDGDELTELDGDCDDTDPNVYPRDYHYDIPGNGRDEDCDGIADEDRQDDWDGDGFTEFNGDCNDYDPLVNPGMTEDPTDWIDNNCDGSVDEIPPIGCACVVGDAKRLSSTRVGIALLLVCAAAVLPRTRRSAFCLALIGGLGLAGCGEYSVYGVDSAPVVELLVPADNQRYVEGETGVAIALVDDKENRKEEIPLLISWTATVPDSLSSGGGTRPEHLATYPVDVSAGPQTVMFELPAGIHLGTWRLEVAAADYVATEEIYEEDDYDFESEHDHVVRDSTFIATVVNDPPTARILRPVPSEMESWPASAPVLFEADVGDDHLRPGELEVSWTFECLDAGTEPEVVEVVPDARGAAFTVQRFFGPGVVRAELSVSDGFSDPVVESVLFTVEEPAEGGEE